VRLVAIPRQGRLIEHSRGDFDELHASDEVGVFDTTASRRVQPACA
jgi:hypothetical protein